MKRSTSNSTVWVWAALAIAGSMCVVSTAGAEYLSPLALTADAEGKTLYVA